MSVTSPVPRAAVEPEASSNTPASGPLARDAARACAVGAAGAVVSLGIAWLRLGPTDLAQVLFAARALLRGLDPYPLVGPGRVFDWQYPLYYPAPAALVLTPIAFLPTALAQALFAGVSVGLLAFGLLRTSGRTRLPLLLAAPVILSVKFGQWGPLLTAAFLLPSLAWVWAAKPNFAIPFLLARPNRRSIAVFVAGGLVLGLVALAIAPAWPLEWWRAARSASYMRPPVLAPWVGPLILFALWRWRDPDARLLLAAACIPQTIWLYNAVPVLLVARTSEESWRLVAWSWAAALVQTQAIYGLPGVALAYDGGTIAQAALFYLPAVWLVLRRDWSPIAAGSPAPGDRRA